MTIVGVRNLRARHDGSINTTLMTKRKRKTIEMAIMKEAQFVITAMSLMMSNMMKKKVGEEEEEDDDNDDARLVAHRRRMV